MSQLQQNQMMRDLLFLQEMGITLTWPQKVNVASEADTSNNENLESSEVNSVKEGFNKPKTVQAEPVEALLSMATPLDKLRANEIVSLPINSHEVADELVASPSTTQTEIPPAVSEKPSVSVAGMDWATLTQSIQNCTQCGLCKDRKQAVVGVGDTKADWLFIGEAPGEHEDLQGEPFVGQAGKLLDNILLSIGLKRHQKVYIANVLKCRPPENRDPLPEEVALCQPYLQRQIELIQPKIIVVIGRFAAQTLLQTDTTIGKLRGSLHRYQNIPVVVSYHPAYLLRSLQDKAKAWEDFSLALKTFNELVANNSTELRG